jgi:hypothetical protein
MACRWGLASVLALGLLGCGSVDEVAAPGEGPPAQRTTPAPDAGAPVMPAASAPAASGTGGTTGQATGGTTGEGEGDQGGDKNGPGKGPPPNKGPKS